MQEGIKFSDNKLENQYKALNDRKLVRVYLDWQPFLKPIWASWNALSCIG
jgi:hypothetical protein